MHDAAPDGQVNAAARPRQAGSTLKPFAYALALDAGRLTPGRVLADVPRRFGHDAPLNFSGDFMGLVTARDALILSLSTPALQAVEVIGLPRFHATLRQLGLESLRQPPAHYDLGLALGNAPLFWTPTRGRQHWVCATAAGAAAQLTFAVE